MKKKKNMRSVPKLKKAMDFLEKKKAKEKAVSSIVESLAT